MYSGDLSSGNLCYDAYDPDLVYFQKLLIFGLLYNVKEIGILQAYFIAGMLNPRPSSRIQPPKEFYPAVGVG